ncbi:MAG TPA: hypothetical protein PLD95_03680 [bacterium]|jgi:hypothetical protein|nr:hypothetical protein [bacterium]HOG38543.1 hypothetical protein [bacterium]HQI03413.1 hypothetical protein [bacterium]
MAKYKYKFGLFHGRFQHVHVGHQKIVDKMLSECREAILLVGECQSYGSKRNPFNILDRIYLIKQIYGDNKRLKIGFFPDPHNTPKTEREYSEWGNWIISFCQFYTGKIPDVVYGGSETKLEWIYINYKIGFEKVDRDDISATQLREYLLRGNISAWQKITDPKIHSCFQYLRKIIGHH